MLRGEAVLAMAPDSDETLLVVGDSLSAAYGLKTEQGWVHLLALRMRAKGYRQSVVNASISGETTSGGAARINDLLARHAPSVVVIALGANDGLRGIDPSITAAHLDTMINAAAAAEASVVVVRVRIPPNYGPQYTAQFDAIFDRIAEREDVTLAPFMLRRFALEPDAFQRDGLHPRAPAQTQILDTLWPTIASVAASTTDLSSMEAAAQ